MPGENHEASALTVEEFLHDAAVDSTDIEVFLNALSRLAVHNLSHLDEELLCGITLLRHKKAGTVASSSERAQRVDEIQYDYADGPCLRAAREGELVHVAEVRDDARWPEYRPRVIEEGIRSILGVPIPIDSGDSAALNLYSNESGRFDEGAIESAQQYARQASRALSLAVRLARHRDAEADLEAALESRTTVALAIGIIMGQNRCSQEEAFALLRSASSRRNIKLRDLAADLVSSADPSSEGTHFDR
ncbi:GAF and ANTAR domain-containing protein [Arthrobacter sulfonylureivorans]|uniref:GAF and ANTAR domain-containing protein n=1 Tax=Arthrobacter sulfonylureivorans TaxID=2486855 RepID=A0ABY3WA76_9MICC|nr:GAF and ANTAR domain-containing protein [Arthrobacter sulfonylureivorans]UNK45227.1 GAF and ANTAR domain-containing protein [Arthrobacter sulfonylureivorans]